MASYPMAFVCLMGIGTVFFGLAGLVLLTKLMSALCGARSHGNLEAPSPSPEVLAAMSAALAEELGPDVTGIRIRSIRTL